MKRKNDKKKLKQVEEAVVQEPTLAQMISEALAKSGITDLKECGVDLVASDADFANDMQESLCGIGADEVKASYPKEEEVEVVEEVTEAEKETLTPLYAIPVDEELVGEMPIDEISVCEKIDDAAVEESEAVELTEEKNTPVEE